MGRNHLKLPNHLVLSPPDSAPTAPSYPFAFSLLSVKSAVYQTPSVTGLPDTYNARAVGDKIPGFKTSAAFFTTLRANLAIDLESPPPSLCNTPDLRPTNLGPSTASWLPLPSPSPLSQVEEPPTIQEHEAGVIEPGSLTTYTATTEDEKVEVLHLVADSVAQQRQYAVAAILSNPTSLVSVLFILGILYRRFFTSQSLGWPTVLTTCVGVMLAIFGVTRMLTKGYIQEAESIGTWDWLEKDRDTTEVVGDDDMFLARIDDQVVGALILRGIRDLSPTNTPTSNGQRKRRQNSKDKTAPVIGLIRGWTVKDRHRCKGIGTELLEEAIKLCQQRGWQGPEIDLEHANCKRHLPAFFTGPLEKRELRARNLLERTKDSMGVGLMFGGRRRR